MQYTANFTCCKNDNFKMKTCDIFSYFCLKTICDAFRDFGACGGTTSFSENLQIIDVIKYATPLGTDKTIRCPTIILPLLLGLRHALDLSFLRYSN